MHKNATKCNKTQSKWCINTHGASKIIDTFETYHSSTGALRLPTRTGVPVDASGRLPPLVVEAVPSRTAAVLLAPFQATFHCYRAGLVFVTLVRQ
jgi:hypothetical protein